jgi:hypothetical protein
MLIIGLRNIFGPKRDKVAVDWRRLHNCELCDPQRTPQQILLALWIQEK